MKAREFVNKQFAPTEQLRIEYAKIELLAEINENLKKAFNKDIAQATKPKTKKTSKPKEEGDVNCTKTKQK